MRAPLSRARREQRARDRTIDVDVPLPGLAGSGDLPADDVLAGELRQLGLDRIAFGARCRPALRRQLVEARRLAPMLQQHLGGSARVLLVHVFGSCAGHVE